MVGLHLTRLPLISKCWLPVHIETYTGAIKCLLFISPSGYNGLKIGLKQ